eukprot:3223224-Amphidinium_carterae.1
MRTQPQEAHREGEAQTASGHEKRANAEGCGEEEGEGGDDGDAICMHLYREMRCNLASGFGM